MNAYLELTKPRVTLLVAFSTLVGFEMGRHGAFAPWLFLATLAGTLFLAGGASALNMWMEAGPDALMTRTCRRPIPSGRVTPAQALGFGLALTAAGLAVMALAVNGLTCLLGLATTASYLLVYTPLKRVSSLSTIVGAVPGALPPVMGWTAASGRVEAGALVLFGILFLWQIPHFLAIAWMYREDYVRGGFKVMPATQADEMNAGRQMILYAVALIPVSLAPTLMGITGQAYFFGAVALGLGYALFSFAAAYGAQLRQARRVLLASVTYLPFLQGLMLLDKIR
jgi:protoheme IX farnesyltransferase